MPLTIIKGPPNSGRTELVRERFEARLADDLAPLLYGGGAYPRLSDAGRASWATSPSGAQ